MADTKGKKQKNRKKKIHKRIVRKSAFTKFLTQTPVVKIGVCVGAVSFLLLFAPIFTWQTGRIAVVMFGVRGLGFAVTGAVSIWIILLLAGHIWDIRPVGPEEREVFLGDFLKRSGACLASILLLAAWAAAGFYFGTDNIKKAVSDCRTGYVQASGRVISADYDHHRHGPGEYDYRIRFDDTAGDEHEFSEIVVSTYRRIKASNTKKALRSGDDGIFFFYPQTRVIDHVFLGR